MFGGKPLQFRSLINILIFRFAEKLLPVIVCRRQINRIDSGDLRSMSAIVNRTRERRGKLDVEFPLIDIKGIVVLHDRRRLSDRRKAKCGIEDLRILLSKLGSH